MVVAAVIGSVATDGARHVSAQRLLHGPAAVASPHLGELLAALREVGDPAENLGPPGSSHACQGPRTLRRWGDALPETAIDNGSPDHGIVDIRTVVGG
jgi:hypothetical protein